MTKILVTGATGNVGREVVAQLPASSVRAFSRQTGGELTRPESLAAAVDGVEAVFLVWPFLTTDGAPQIRSTGVVRGPGIPATAVVHERDLAEVAARALSGGLPGRRLVLTGPQILTRTDQVEALGRALGRELRFEPLSAETARAQLLADGRPTALVDALLANVGRPPSTLITPTIEQLTGAPARTFGSWAEEHADEFR